MDLVRLEGRKGGVRGGKDTFNWDDVKGDRHRENYLGHSVKASVGRWQEGKDLEWFSKKKHTDATAAERAADDERHQVRQREKRLISEAVTRGGKVAEAVRLVGVAEGPPATPTAPTANKETPDEVARKNAKRHRKAERDRIRHERRARREARLGHQGHDSKKPRTS